MTDKLRSVTSHLNNLNLTEEDTEKIPCHDRCKIVNSNPVLVARPVQFLAEFFLMGKF